MGTQELHSVTNRGQIDFLGGSSGSQRAENFFREGESSLICRIYYSYVYLQIVDLKYSALFDIRLFG